jgi:AcrR family transcriptional regulator
VARRRGGRRDRAGRARPGGRHAAEEDQLSRPRTRPTGRRPGSPDTREAVLAAARSAFAERGFDGATIRGIARAAGVDPALVHHYFGTKDKLFLAAVQAPVDPAELLPEALAGGSDELGAALLRLFLRTWDGPAQAAGLALIRSALGSEWTTRLLREFLVARVLRHVVATLDVPDAEREARGALVAAQLVGLAMTRYVLRLEPLASASPEALVAAVAPTLQRYLTGELTVPVP